MSKSNKEKNLRWWFGPNSLWAKVCKFLGEYPQWVYQRTITVLVCTKSWKLATAKCIGSGNSKEVECKELLCPKEECDLQHIVWMYPMACEETGMRPTAFCPTLIEKKMTEQEYDVWQTKYCTKHKKPQPHEIDKLPLAMTVPALYKKYGRPIIISPWLIPSALIESSEKFDHDFFVKEALGPVVKKGMANSDRVFAIGSWEPASLKYLEYPYARNANGLFKLGAKNKKYYDQLLKRIGDRADRRWFTIVTITDNCSTHVGRPGFWRSHPWNGENNVNRTSNWKGSIYHFYEEEHQDAPGIKESAAWIEIFYREMAQLLQSEFGEWIGIEIVNEGQAGDGYHTLIKGWLVEEGIGLWRIFTSLDKVNVDFYKKTIWNSANYYVHGIKDTFTHAEAITEMPVLRKDKGLFNLAKAKYPWMEEGGRLRIPFVLSEDGEKPHTDYNGYRKLVMSSLTRGDMGFESNSRPDYYGNDMARWLQQPDTWSRFDAIGKGFKDFLKG